MIPAGKDGVDKLDITIIIWYWRIGLMYWFDDNGGDDDDDEDDGNGDEDVVDDCDSQQSYVWIDWNHKPEFLKGLH